MLYSEFAARTMTTAAQKILVAQRRNLLYFYNEQTGHIRESLTDQVYKVQKSASGVQLLGSYLVDLRFLDLKTTAMGKKKKLYGPVYNRPLWGVVYGYLLGTLQYGLTEQVRTEIFEEIKESINILEQ